ncbi:hypothetical protein MITS9509_01007 [Synechococcus sp. MIT S9509]|nr:hypothetical protein MITS9504_00571 [Synechococcus sp. MIT S9504]KZR92558.1 hypothetical protein MITS9509_01007 [Synechococcus sp. MIT S9509]
MCGTLSQSLLGSLLSELIDQVKPLGLWEPLCVEFSVQG